MGWGVGRGTAGGDPGGVTREPRFPRDIPPLWLLGSLLAMGVLRWLWPGWVCPHRAPLWLGGAMLGSAILLLLVSAGLFHRAHTGIRPFTPATALVLRGPYRWTRNPMYVALTGIALGTALALGALTPLFVPPLFWWVLDRRFVRAEERFLSARFGADYGAYCARVRRWL